MSESKSETKSGREGKNKCILARRLHCDATQGAKRVLKILNASKRVLKVLKRLNRALRGTCSKSDLKFSKRGKVLRI